MEDDVESEVSPYKQQSDVAVLNKQFKHQVGSEFVLIYAVHLMSEWVIMEFNVAAGIFHPFVGIFHPFAGIFHPFVGIFHPFCGNLSPICGNLSPICDD